MDVNQNLQIIISPHSTNISPCVARDCIWWQEIWFIAALNTKSKIGYHLNIAPCVVKQIKHNSRFEHYGYNMAILPIMTIKVK